MKYIGIIILSMSIFLNSCDNNDVYEEDDKLESNIKTSGLKTSDRDIWPNIPSPNAHYCTHVGNIWDTGLVQHGEYDCTAVIFAYVYQLLYGNVDPFSFERNLPKVIVDNLHNGVEPSKWLEYIGMVYNNTSLSGTDEIPIAIDNGKCVIACRRDPITMKGHTIVIVGYYESANGLMFICYDPADGQIKDASRQEVSIISATRIDSCKFPPS